MDLMSYICSTITIYTNEYEHQKDFTDLCRGYCNDSLGTTGSATQSRQHRRSA